MSARVPQPAESDEIARTAAEWTQRVQQGLSRAEKAELARWLEQDIRHADVYSEMSETSTLLDRLRDPALARVPESAPATRRVARRWLPVTLAAAAALVLGGLAWWRDPAVGTAGGVYTYAADTRVGAVRTVALPDGSRVMLNTASAVDVRFSAGERRVRLLRGEAFFTVAKDAGRPFRVEAGSVGVRAVGTAFNVRHRPAGVEVVVTEGKVSVDAPRPPADAAGLQPANAISMTEPKEPALLVAGQKALVVLSTTREVRELTVISVERNQLENALAWQEGRLKFYASPMSEVVEEFNRHNAHQLVIGDAELGTETFGGAFAPGGYAAFVEVLEQSFGVVAERQGDRTILRKAR